MKEKLVGTIRSGGQSGVDRGALDAARDIGTPISGWCPRGGWAEDLLDPPGLLKLYPEMIETPSRKIEQRTEWNARDSSATLILCSNEGKSPGTDATIEFAKKYKKPYMVVTHQSPTDVFSWLIELGENLTLNVAGPRESEAPGAYDYTKRFILELLKLQEA